VAFWKERIKNIPLNTLSPTSVSVEWGKAYNEEFCSEANSPL